MFVGWDWASATHDVTVIDNAGTVVDHWTPPHTETGLGETVIRLARWGRSEELPVAIEQSSGLVVDRLLAAGHPVVPIHATAFHAARPRWALLAPSRTRVTATSWPTTCAPIASGYGDCSSWTMPPESCKPWCGCVRTMSRPRSRPATSSAPCWTLTGRAPRRSSPG